MSIYLNYNLLFIAFVKPNVIFITTVVIYFTLLYYNRCKIFDNAIMENVLDFILEKKNIY